MVHSTIPSVTSSLTPLGYTGTASSLTSVTTQVLVISASTTSAGGTSPFEGFGGGGGGSRPPPPPLPSNPVLNTILQNIGQLQLQLTNIASTSSQSCVLAYYRKSPLEITILNTILLTVAESLKFDKFNGDGDPNVHIDSFKTMCSDYHILHFVLLKLFSRSLKGTPFEWYSSMLDHSIHTFD